MGRLTAAATGLCVVMVLAGCTPHKGPDGGAGSSVGPTDPAPAQAGATDRGGPSPSAGATLSADATIPGLGGLFGLEGAQVIATDDKVKLHASYACDTLVNVLDAGQWDEDVMLSPTGTLHLYEATLMLEGRTALAVLEPSTNSCTANISLPSQQTVSVGGADSIDGESQFLAFGCAYDPTDDAGSVSFTGNYDGPGDSHLLIDAVFPTAVGTHEVEPDATDVSISHSQSLLDLVKEALVLSTGGIDEEDISFDGVATYVADEEGSELSVDVTSHDPLEGTLRLHSLVNSDDDGGPPLEVEATFRCAS